MPDPAPAGRRSRGPRWRPLTLSAKEGLALLNGTQLMAGLGALAHHDALRLAITADVIGAMSLEAMLGTGAAFAEQLIAARPHAGQVASARHLRALLAGSEIGASHAESDHRVQDAYSLRCMPQVHGAARDALGELAQGAERGDQRGHRQPARLSDRRGDLAAATSTGSRWPWRSTTRRWPSPSWPPSRSGAPLAWWTRTSPGCRPSSPSDRVSRAA